MKTILKFTAIILIALGFTMCNSKQNESTENFDWLLGKWQRTNEKQGKTTFENWEKITIRNITELVLPFKIMTP